MKRLASLILILSCALLAGGCAFNAGYNPAYISAQPLALGVPGKSLVVLETNDAQWIYSGKPTSFTGGGTTLTVPLGEITKQIALKVFGAAFKDGADFREKAGDAAGYRLIVQPKISKFTYAYNQLKNLGFAITPQASIELHMVLISPDGTKLTDKFLSSGLVDGDSYMLSGQPAERVNQLLHQVLFKLMTDAAVEAKAALEHQPVSA